MREPTTRVRKPTARVRESTAQVRESMQRVQESRTSRPCRGRPRPFNASDDERPGTRFWLSSMLDEAVVHGFEAAAAANRPSAFNTDIAAAPIINHLTC
ncbi:hypothetical protein [Amycolatopsis sp. Hca4]|uniref:hypothetical protein n=1 Tax=Amycolatopsis sp. Hca4 TaxID=2742131 RepID=UPI001590FD77|nr:hypothetical protein [Amycolatopsis sp. Hca4]QKV76676.1 hypothetical protein HUT10_25035 [Amycolatopsis sp. Hca4]